MTGVSSRLSLGLALLSRTLSLGYSTVSGPASLSRNGIKAEVTVNSIDDSLSMWAVEIKAEDLSFELLVSGINSSIREVDVDQFTTGTAYRLSKGTISPCGNADIVIMRGPKNIIHVEGSFDDNDQTYQLSTANSMYILNEGPSGFGAPLDTISYPGLSRLTSKKEARNWPTRKGIASAMTDRYQEPYSMGKMEALVGVVVDSSFVSAMESPAKAYLAAIDTLNNASKRWKDQLNVTLRVAEVVVAQANKSSYLWDMPCSDSKGTSSDLSTRLDALSQWRKESGRANDGLAFWVMLSDCPAGGVLGLSQEASVCRDTGASVVRRSVLDDQAMAHEVGHLFGAVHDCTNSTCGSPTLCCPLSTGACDANEAYIMSPGLNPSQKVFSNCTKASVSYAMRNKDIDTSCLKRGHQQTVEIKRCSNLIDPVLINECLRVTQCQNYLNTNDTYFCGEPQDCKLLCFDHHTGECRDTGLALLDGTPCAQADSGTQYVLCGSGKCHGVSDSALMVPLWFSSVLAVALVVVLVIIGGFIYVVNRLYRRYFSKFGCSEPSEEGPKADHSNAGYIDK